MNRERYTGPLPTHSLQRHPVQLLCLLERKAGIVISFLLPIDRFALLPDSDLKIEAWR